MKAWESQLPPGWSVKRLKHVASLRSGEGITSESIEDTGDYPVYGGNGRRGFTESFTHDGDFVLIGRQGALCGNVHLVNGQFWASEHAVVATFYAGDNPRWARHLLEHMKLGQYSVASAQPGLAVDRIKELAVPVPPTDEQLAIATYLEVETARIDALITSKFGLVDLLNEMLKASLDDHIQGVHEKGPRQASASMFHGPVPRGWKTVRLKFLLASIEQGWSPQTETRSAELGEWGVLKAGACNAGVFRPDEQKALPREITADPNLEVRPGDILMSRGSGSVDLVGSVALVPADVRPKLLLCDLLYRLTIDNQEIASPEWLVMALNSSPLRRQIRLALRGAEGLTRKISTAEIKELILVLPPPEVQSRIVKACKEDAAKLTALREHVGREIEKLSELRTVTVADAVLGRIDVRANASH